jgi:hypothetical protein
MYGGVGKRVAKTGASLLVMTGREEVGSTEGRDTQKKSCIQLERALFQRSL